MPTRAYDEALRATQHLHATSKKFSGKFLPRYLDVLEPAIRAIPLEHGMGLSVLDYGCGKGVQWREPIDEQGTMLQDHLRISGLALYDPGVPEFSRRPSRRHFDVVICTQVLGSIPISDLGWVIDELYGYADKLLFVGERVRKVRKQLHAHMKGQMPHEWTAEQWREVLRPRAGDTATRLMKKSDGLRVLAKIKENDRTTVLDL